MLGSGMVRGVVIICFSAPLHLEGRDGQADGRHRREKRGGSARVANVTGNKNRPSGSRKLQSLQAASTDSETDNMYGRHGGIAGRKRSFVDYSWTIVPRTSSRLQEGRRTTIDTVCGDELVRSCREHPTIDFYHGIENCAKNNQ